VLTRGQGGFLHSLLQFFRRITAGSPMRRAAEGNRAAHLPDRERGFPR
jgi:hypothetical protein